MEALIPVLLWYYTQINSGSTSPSIIKEYAIIESMVAGLSVEEQQKVIYTINKESRFNPKALNRNDMAIGCHSRGLVQIRSCNHNVTDEQAYNPIFAINFLIRNIDKCKTWWKGTCGQYKELGSDT